MKIATAFSTDLDTVLALKTAYRELERQLGSAPTWMTVYTTFQHPGELVVETLQTLAPGVPFQGGTSCLGVMTEAGYHSADGVSLGLFGILDPDGVYAIGAGEDPNHAWMTGRNVMLQALDAADQETLPALVWITCVPGNEEDVLVGIEEGLGGTKTPIIGGSSADNTIEGHWYQITNGRVLRDGVVVTAMYPSTPIRFAFDNSYAPTNHTGHVTKASGRTIYEINRRPAAEVYNEWTNGTIEDYMDGGNILAPSTFYPIGRAAEWTRGVIFYQLSHPAEVFENHALSLFTRVEAGEKIVLMASSVDDLIYRVDRITSKALKGITAPEEQVAGALIIYCAGCMMAVQDDMPEVVNEFNRALKGQPFLGLYTFGEQGCAMLGENVHGNLMMSMIVFEQ